MLCAAGATALALGAGATAATAAPTTTGTLYVQQAAHATLERSGSAWKLVLERPDAHVIAFADRPARTGTALRTRAFVGAWGASFGGDPPNAALQIEGAPASRDVALLELSAPKLSHGGARLTYRARPLTATSAALGGLAARADGGVSGRFGRVTLFIDDGGAAAGTLSVSVSGVAPGDSVSVGLTTGTIGFTPDAVTTLGATGQWGVAGDQVMLQCGGPATCSGTATVAVAPAAAATLAGEVVLNSGSVTLSWSGGAQQTFSTAPGQAFSLSAGS
jgi:hypothetical protein